MYGWSGGLVDLGTDFLLKGHAGVGALPMWQAMAYENQVNFDFKSGAFWG